MVFREIVAQQKGIGEANLSEIRHPGLLHLSYRFPLYGEECWTVSEVLTWSSVAGLRGRHLRHRNLKVRQDILHLSEVTVDPLQSLPDFPV